MGIFDKSYRITSSVIIVVVLTILTVVTLCTYWYIDCPSSKWGALFGSLTAGLIVAVIQFFTAWQEYKETEKQKRLKLMEFLYKRAERDKYAEYIKSCNRELDVMGVTAVRFFNDFADTSNGAPDNAKVLLQALDRRVVVRVLLPAEEYLPNDKKADYARVRAKCRELQKYQNLQVRYFNHPAAHSIFNIDDTSIIGPVFPELESRNTPALHVMKSSPMALNYLDYFNAEWNSAQSV